MYRFIIEFSLIDTSSYMVQYIIVFVFGRDAHKGVKSAIIKILIQIQHKRVFLFYFFGNAIEAPAQNFKDPTPGYC